MRKIHMLLGASALVAAPIAPASAVALNFVLTGSRSATFTLDSNPTPSSSTGLQTFFANVPGTFGTSTVAPSISFGTSGASAFEIVGTSLGFSQFSAGGLQLFSGTTAAPVFAAGTFNLSSIVSGQSVLTISAAPAAAVPEPATWGMMILGFGLVGAAMRSRRRAVVAA